MGVLFRTILEPQRKQENKKFSVYAGSRLLFIQLQVSIAIPEIFQVIFLPHFYWVSGDFAEFSFFLSRKTDE